MDSNLLRKKQVQVNGKIHRVSFALVDERTQQAISFYTYLSYGQGREVTVGSGVTTTHSHKQRHDLEGVNDECEHIGACYCDSRTEGSDLTMNWLLNGDEVIWAHLTKELNFLNKEG